MKLYMHPISITSRPVRLLLAEKNIACDQEVVDVMTGAHHQEPFVSINPNRQVPVLVDGDLSLTESSAILKYLADKYDLPEYPKDLKQRAKVNEAMDWFNTQFYRDWGYNLSYPQIYGHHKRPSDEGQRVALEWGKEKSAFWLGILNDNMLGQGNKYLTGNQITIADYFGAGLVSLGQVLRTDFSKYPNIENWLKQVHQLKHWADSSEVITGFTQSLKDQDFVVV